MAAISPRRNVEMTGSDWLTSIDLRYSNLFERTPEAGLRRFLFLNPVELPSIDGF